MIKLKNLITEAAKNTTYWKQYHGGGKQLKGELSKESMKKFESLFDTRIEYWEDLAEADNSFPSNIVPKALNKRIKTTAETFFKEAGWISADIIDAMIMQGA